MKVLCLTFWTGNLFRRPLLTVEYAIYILFTYLEKGKIWGDSIGYKICFISSVTLL
jgi:hypothetical protein